VPSPVASPPFHLDRPPQVEGVATSRTHHVCKVFCHVHVTDFFASLAKFSLLTFMFFHLWSMDSNNEIMMNFFMEKENNANANEENFMILANLERLQSGR
jgi:hypothetical protein